MPTDRHDARSTMINAIPFPYLKAKAVTGSGSATPAVEAEMPLIFSASWTGYR
jgi:hypothetical protein